MMFPGPSRHPGVGPNPVSNLQDVLKILSNYEVLRTCTFTTTAVAETSTSSKPVFYKPASKLKYIPFIKSTSLLCILKVAMED